MKVLIADKFEQTGRDGLDAAGCDYSYQPDVKDDTLTEAIRGYQPDALVVRGTKVTEPMMDAGPLKLIVRHMNIACRVMRRTSFRRVRQEHEARNPN